MRQIIILISFASACFFWPTVYADGNFCSPLDYLITKKVLKKDTLVMVAKIKKIERHREELPKNRMTQRDGSYRETFKYKVKMMDVLLGEKPKEITSVEYVFTFSAGVYFSGPHSGQESYVKEGDTCIFFLNPEPENKPPSRVFRIEPIENKDDVLKIINLSPTEKGILRAKDDIDRKNAKILHYGKPWSQGKPLVDDASGLPVKIITDDNITSDFAEEIDAYNKVMRETAELESKTEPTH